MRYFVSFFVSVIILSFLAFASDSNGLNIRVEAIRERQSTYMSAADSLEIRMFTPKSAEIERQYSLFMEEKRRQTILGIFDETDMDIRTESERIQEKAESLGLFHTGFDPDRHHRPVMEDESRGYNPVIIFLSILLLCFTGFLFSRRRHKQRKKRKQNAAYSND